MQIGRQIQDLKRYPSCQDAAGLDGEPIDSSGEFSQDLQH